jgi:hypothetical protein
MGMFIIHFTMPKNLVVILENKKVSQNNIRQWPIWMDKKIYILVTNCFKQTLFIS